MESYSTDYVEYQKAIESLIKSNSNAVISSNGSQHASIVTAKIFENAATSVKIITGNFSGIVSDSTIYLDALNVSHRPSTYWRRLKGAIDLQAN